VKESALCLAAEEDGQGESISKADSEDSVRRVLSYYISSQHLAEWLQGLLFVQKPARRAELLAPDDVDRNINILLAKTGRSRCTETRRLQDPLVTL